MLVVIFLSQVIKLSQTISSYRTFIFLNLQWTAHDFSSEIRQQPGALQPDQRRSRDAWNLRHRRVFVVKLLKPWAVWRNVFYITPITHAHKRLLFKKDHSHVYVCKHLEPELQAAVGFLFKGITCSQALSQLSSPQKGHAPSIIYFY